MRLTDCVLLVVGRLLTSRNKTSLMRIRNFVGRRAEGESAWISDDRMETGTLQDVLASCL